jgi:transposase
VFLDESGFLLIPNVRRTWAPRGQTPILHYLYKQDRISSINALSLSPKRKRLALYLRFRGRNFNGLDVRSFLKALLKHLRGPIVLLWDRGTIHRRKEVTQFLRENPRVHMEYFPAYAPELNPAEYVWNQADRALSNAVPQSLGDLKTMLRNTVRRLRRSPRLLWSCIFASDLPWAR